MSSNIFKIGQRIQFRNVGDKAWSASYIVRATTGKGLILGTSKETKHMFSVYFDNTEFQVVEEVNA